MPLSSPRFAHSARLQNAAINAPPMGCGEKGDPVAIVQQAYLDLGYAMPISTQKTGKPDGIFGNETASITRKFQDKHGLDIDGIVGRDTLGTLDRLLPSGPTPPPPQRRKPRFVPNTKNDGFDATASPPWLMVPVGGVKSIRVLNAHNLDIVCVNPAVAEIQVYPEWDPATGRTLKIRGIVKGVTFIEVRQAGRLLARLQVAVKTQKVVKITFNFVSDNTGRGTTRNPAEVDGWVSKANAILLPQANVKIVKHNVNPNVVVNQNLGNVVRFSSHLPGVAASEHEWDVVTARRDGTADLNVFFVWEYEQDATPDEDNTAAGTSGGNCIFEDNTGRQTHDTLAHEVGHHLGAEHSGDGLDLLMSPFRSDTRISKQHANTMNP